MRVADDQCNPDGSRATFGVGGSAFLWYFLGTCGRPGLPRDRPAGQRRHLLPAERALPARRRAGRRRQRAARRLRRRHPVRRLRRMKRVPSAARRDWRRTVESQGLVYPVTILDDGTRGAVLVRGRGVRARRVGGRAPRGRDRPAARHVRRGRPPPGHRRLRHARAVRAGAGRGQGLARRRPGVRLRPLRPALRRAGAGPAVRVQRGHPDRADRVLGGAVVLAAGPAPGAGPVELAARAAGRQPGARTPAGSGRCCTWPTPRRRPPARSG